jgi:hypothetical protein
MPPKVAPTPVVASNKGLKISISFTKVKSDTDITENVPKYRLRMISEWLDCCGTTSIFGEGDLQWIDDPISSDNDVNVSTENDFIRKKAIYSNSFNDTFLEKDKDRDKLRLFNMNAGIYFIILRDAVENNASVIVPERFSFMECSSFLIENKSKTTTMNNVGGNINIQITVDIEKPLLPKSETISLEPLVLDIGR